MMFNKRFVNWKAPSRAIRARNVAGGGRFLGERRELSGMRPGEGSVAALATHVVRAGFACHACMASFTEAGVSKDGAGTAARLLQRSIFGYAKRSAAPDETDIGQN
jgi:hypothetical protein